jgi:hypothetical protein
MTARKKSAARRSVRKSSAAAKASVRVRMYRQGLGDCFLLTFKSGAHVSHMLIDFGTLGEQTTGVEMKDVADSIVAECGSHLAMLVATHEHQDHLSGILRFKASHFADPAFKIDRVWQAWTEDASEPLAQRLTKHEHDLLEATAVAATALAARGAAGEEQLRRVRAALAFHSDEDIASPLVGAKKFAETVDEAMTWVTERATNDDKFLVPGTVIEPDWAPGIRFYVLGPPQDEAAINSLGGHGDAELYELSARVGSDLDTCARFAISGKEIEEYKDSLPGDQQAEFKRRLPFDPRFRLESTDSKAVARVYANYEDPEKEWRRIDTEWLRGAADLALQLDNSTNNTSLVLAIEIISNGKVLLFPGDAQKGNWMSWDALQFKVDGAGGTRTVTAADLLARTVLYKVGHHSSHNATTKDRGLELMTHRDLVAMIPLDQITAENKWPTAAWPAEALYEALLTKTKGRVLRSDLGLVPDSHRPSGVEKADWDGARGGLDAAVLKIEDFCVDYTVS